MPFSAVDGEATMVVIVSLCAKADSAIGPLPPIAPPLSQAIITGGRETTSRDIRSGALDLAEWLRLRLTAASVF